ncbi:hypothetical protein GCE9029_03318 [Grimontia celer]|uniref:Uncharacterized protein n=1 Tax=Grimontia celer TaxID=1796497 RepID=A0A128F723_9GAMM|nr:hypothetical protein [Grimontia celer]CZF82589.1 hypothetical protein GCE9029_03318 [Grimontia celer]
MSEKPSDMDKNHAILNKPLSFVILMLGMTFGVLNLQLVLGGEEQSLLMNLLYGFLAFVAIFVSLFWVFDSKNTRVTDEYVEKGKSRIYWHEVTHAKSNEFSIVISASKIRVVVNYYAYRNPEGLMKEIQSRLPNSK